MNVRTAGESIAPLGPLWWHKEGPQIAAIYTCIVNNGGNQYTYNGGMIDHTQLYFTSQPNVPCVLHV